MVVFCENVWAFPNPVFYCWKQLSELCLVHLLQDIQQVKTPEELEKFMLKHGENIIDTLGAEVDRLEKELKVKNLRRSSCLRCFSGTSLDSKVVSQISL